MLPGLLFELHGQRQATAAALFSLSRRSGKELKKLCSPLCGRSYVRSITALLSRAKFGPSSSSFSSRLSLRAGYIHGGSSELASSGVYVTRGFSGDEGENDLGDAGIIGRERRSWGKT